MGNSHRHFHVAGASDGVKKQEEGSKKQEHKNKQWKIK